ncbi:hypothetical protein P5G51_008105 [Virgibacillus sp. 179-BFC.A HS]|uniref:Replicative helicase loading/DNA remodeling protein DnaB N-terminal winged helix domain-containing protein n=1 Tax=Tigheibacillus jepli TaxID=3035914 RepID=A0ABU5CGB7_9BACI|nr:hypothetical protein [Virgibacillus sp. 179-BFC.A HS]MDY0405364.1 hypothetical protein [Virgibacillus sp. 179-BFC.A HS]
MSYIAKILPVDGYRVSLHGNLPVDYAVTLTHLYQPILGAKPVMLYQTLLHEMDFMTDTGVQTHHTLMNYLCLPLDEIYEARVKLEGIGLMQTYKQKTADETTVYYYELQIPFSSHAFFEEPMLSQLLYHHIGKQKFTALKSHYAKRSPQPLGSEITASFNDVFETVRPSKHGTKPTIDDLENVGPNVEEIDFTYLIHVCKQRMLPTHKIFTPVNRRIITQMVTLYQLTSYEIENCLLWALTEENELNVEAFKSACHDLFQASGRNIHTYICMQKSRTFRKKRKQLTRK